MTLDLHLRGLLPRLFVAALWVCGLSAMGCELITDIDRSLIGHQGGSAGDGGAGGQGGGSATTTAQGGSTGTTTSNAGNGGDGGTATTSSGGSTGTTSSTTTGQGGSGGMPDCEPTSSTRLEAVEAVVAQATAAGKLAGYKTPTSSSYADVAVGSPAFVSVHRAVWLKLLTPASDGSDLFLPDDSSDTCFEQGLADGLAALPKTWLVLDSSSNKSVTLASGTVTVVTYNVYGVGGISINSVRVVNRLSDDNFTLSEASDALDSVSGVHVGCKDQQSGVFSDVSKPLSAAGDATFSNLNCTDPTGVTVIRIQADPAQVGTVRLALDPTSIEDANSDPVIIRVWPKNQSPVWPGTMTVTP